MAATISTVSPPNAWKNKVRINICRGVDEDPSGAASAPTPAIATVLVACARPGGRCSMRDIILEQQRERDREEKAEREKEMNTRRQLQEQQRRQTQETKQKTKDNDPTRHPTGCVRSGSAPAVVPRRNPWKTLPSSLYSSVGDHRQPVWVPSPSPPDYRGGNSMASSSAGRKDARAENIVAAPMLKSSGSQQSSSLPSCGPSFPSASMQGNKMNPWHKPVTQAQTPPSPSPPPHQQPKPEQRCSRHLQQQQCHQERMPSNSWHDSGPSHRSVQFGPINRNKRRRPYQDYNAVGGGGGGAIVLSESFSSMSLSSASSTSSTASQRSSSPGDAPAASFEGDMFQDSNVPAYSSSFSPRAFIAAADSAAAADATCAVAPHNSYDGDCDAMTCEQQSHYVSLDCEMVGAGPNGERSLLARVSVVGWDGKILFDTYVKPTECVTDYRTFVSGIRRENLDSDSAMDATECREAVRNLLRGKVLVGHALKNDLAALGLTHPWYDVRDTAKYAPYMAVVQHPPQVFGHPSHNCGALGCAESDCSSSTTSTSSSASSMDHHDTQGIAPAWDANKTHLRPRKLRELASFYLGLEIQTPGSEHSPIEDARAALGLYKLAREHWEKTMYYKVIKTREILQCNESTKGGKSVW